LNARACNAGTKGHFALTTDVLAELLVSKSRGRFVGAAGFFCLIASPTRRSTTMLQVNQPQTTAAALNVERGREKAQAVRACEAEVSAYPDRDRQTSHIISGIGLHPGLSQLDARRWTRTLGSYTTPNHVRSATELAITALPLVTLWTAAWFTFSLGHAWASSLIAIPAAGFLMRMFMIQHDCGHGTFFASRLANDWVGRVIGVLTLTPYDCWRRTHAIHHATTGNLDRRGIGDVDTLTVREYRARSWWGRLKYRAYRHPLIMFGIGPAYLFLLQHRIPVGLMRKGWQPWASTMATNLAIALIIAVLMWFIGIKAFLLVHLPITLLAAMAGVWLFYVQHQFEHTTWERDGRWTLQQAALHGSSHYDLPALLRWFTANIGIHHVHHLCSRIPYYRLPRVLREHPELREVGHITLLESFRCVRLVLWDEAQHRLVSFREFRAQSFRETELSIRTPGVGWFVIKRSRQSRP
jgi:acyl-lipid omega-6 desaturase (Delta-12 desaturase)